MTWIHSMLASLGLGRAPGAGSVPYRTRGDAEFFGEDRLNFRRPTGFADVEEIADLLKEDQPIVVNLELTKADERRRIVDFLFGVIYALEGDVCKVAEGVFVFTPNRIGIDAPDADMARRAYGAPLAARVANSAY